MVPLRALNALAIAPVFHFEPQLDRYKELAGFVRSQGVGPFLLKFAVARIFFDLSFYLNHRSIHHRKLYAAIHSKHHEHHEPGLSTNQHFTVSDLFLEGTAPLLAGLGALFLLEFFGSRVTRFEATYILVAMLWYLNVSHTGKQVPTGSIFPPLAFIPDIDAKLGGGVAHHHQHHRAVRCNYGIAAWPDIAFGTKADLRQLSE
mmetsp:Transcript_26079/g.63025  ORF Transcript_26079/g.63025 Transcript_26079/m.63025 type:complete len:203 (+) Transcript_26079:18-626(+)